MMSLVTLIDYFALKSIFNKIGPKSNVIKLQKDRFYCLFELVTREISYCTYVSSFRCVGIASTTHISRRAWNCREKFILLLSFLYFILSSIKMLQILKRSANTFTRSAYLHRVRKLGKVRYRQRWAYSLLAGPGLVALRVAALRLALSHITFLVWRNKTTCVMRMYLPRKF